MNFNSKLALVALLIPTFASPMQWFNTPLKKAAGITAAAGLCYLGYQAAKSYGFENIKTTAGNSWTSCTNWLHSKVHASCQESSAQALAKKDDTIAQKDTKIAELTAEKNQTAAKLAQFEQITKDRNACFSKSNILKEENRKFVEENKQLKMQIYDLQNKISAMQENNEESLRTANEIRQNLEDKRA
jgi:predicted RNase H-like nuclease (RuvC/YqgF family)